MAKNSQFRNRLPVFIRDDWRCQFCGKDLLADEQSLRQATVDHFIPTKLGGNGNNKNLVACCFLCNQAKGSFPVAEATGDALLALPISPFLRDEQRDYVIETLLEACGAC